MVMIVAMNQMNGTNYSRYLLINSIDAENLDHARKLFSMYQEQGVILSDSFEDDEWILTDQRSRVHLGFRFSELLFHENTRDWIACTANCYKEAEKAYVTYQLGALSLISLRCITNAFDRMAEADYHTAIELKRCPNHMLELLKLLPGYSSERDAVIEVLEDTQITAYKNKSNHRELADFQSYFCFHDEVNAFWTRAMEQEKLFYFPLFLWWNLTAILPLRPTEFLLIPRDCLDYKDGKCYITIRRTKMKGGNSKLTYRIDGDYEKKSYSITDDMEQEIRWYQDATSGMLESPIGTLFCREACSYYKRWDKGTAIDTAYNYDNLSNTLKIFYQEMLSGRDDISEIHLGDTRHIAMMNLIISGGSPVVCMELAGHDDIDISSNYYANMAKLVECSTYEMYRKNKKGAMAVVNGRKDYELTKTEALTRIKDGWCTSENRKVMMVDDCIMAMNSLGEMGDCHSCRYFRADRQGVQMDFYDTVKGKSGVNADSWFLMHMIEAVREGIGFKENIKTALLRLQHSCKHYRDCLITKYERDDGYGKT